MRSIWGLRIISFCIFIFAIGCKHQKAPSSKQKNKKNQGVAKANQASIKKNNDQGHPLANNNKTILEEKLGVSEKELKNNKLFLFINDWYGVPYKYGGCQKTGVDCSCFTNLLYEKVYNKKTARSADQIYNECEKILPDELREGDFIFFKINSSMVSHVGVYIRNKLFVHSSTSKGVIINSMDEAYYKKYFHSGGRFKNT